MEKARRNWWKVAFWLALIAFEFMRELAVLADADAQNPRLTAFATVSHGSDFVFASGQWNRVDGGDPLSPNSVKISCDRATKKCIQSDITAFKGSISGPDIRVFDAQFNQDSVTYETSASCTRTRIRIDLKLEKVFSVRELRGLNDPSVLFPCNIDTDLLEKRIESTLTDAPSSYVDRTKGHIVPLVDLLIFVFRL